ncbi:MAG: exodeoxyribonuclease VII large subunit [Actinomycetota bacterium]|nr:exodeoxyribonuclease VII large subunit [Actinomycetota bacterium]
MARLETTPEAPIPVRVVAQKIGEWIARLGEIWVDGQIAQLTRRPGAATQFLTLRDPDANISLTVTCARAALADSIGEGSRVIVRGRPDFWLERGTLSLRATEIRLVGLGELLARLEALKKLLTAEGLFAADRKKPLPFLPQRVGLITGRASAAERDVVEHARRRLPGIRFRVENVATQGPSAVNEIVAAVELLDADPSIEIIVIARGGGSVEDLLPFSNESLLRAVAGARTPIVSAIGHETDSPLLNYVADLAASTPTDAGKRIVPDLAQEVHEIATLRGRSRACVHRRVDADTELIAGLPERMRRTLRARIEGQARETSDLRDRTRRRALALLDAAHGELEHVRARVATLSPQATLDRGYAVVRRPDGTVIRDAAQAAGPLRIRVARGEFDAQAR